MNDKKQKGYDEKKKLLEKERKSIASIHAAMAFGGRLGSRDEWQAVKNDKD
ncbi:MAG: hypothetical protein ABH826_01490 [Patescibacteria group bacterium]